MSKSVQTQQKLTIGKLASAAGVNVETIRYYQRIGLIAEPDRPQQGYRKYPTESIDHIKFIKRAQQLGFSLEEIADLISLGDGHCRDIRERAETKREKIESQIRDLQVLCNTLTKMINAWYSGKNKHTCPIVESLLSGDEKSNT